MKMRPGRWTAWCVAAAANIAGNSSIIDFALRRRSGRLAGGQRRHLRQAWRDDRQSCFGDEVSAIGAMFGGSMLVACRQDVQQLPTPTPPEPPTYIQPDADRPPRRAVAPVGIRLGPTESIAVVRKKSLYTGDTSVRI